MTKTIRTLNIGYTVPGRLSMIVLAISALTLFASLCAPSIHAQKRITTKKVTNKKKPVKVKNKETIESLSPICPPPSGDHFSVLFLDSKLNLSLTRRSDESSEVVSKGLQLSSLEKILSGIGKESILTIQADPTLSFDSVANFFKSVRRISNRCVYAEASTDAYDPYVLIPPEPKKKNEINIKPNPLTLIARLDESGVIYLNNEETGSTTDTKKIIDFLSQIFRDRAVNGVFRENSNEVEKTVFVKPARSTKFGDVIKLVDALKKSGASPVGLQIDALDSDDEDVMEITATPPKKPR